MLPIVSLFKWTDYNFVFFSVTLKDEKNQILVCHRGLSTYPSSHTAENSLIPRRNWMNFVYSMESRHDSIDDKQCEESHVPSHEGEYVGNYDP